MTRMTDEKPGIMDGRDAITADSARQAARI